LISGAYREFRRAIIDPDTLIHYRRSLESSPDSDTLNDNFSELDRFGGLIMSIAFYKFNFTERELPL
jgi:hypothetical protein